MQQYFSAVKALVPSKPDFERTVVPGFQNNGVVQATADCEGRRRNATLGVLPSFSVQDDLTRAVQGLHAYPQVEDAFQNQSLGFEEFVDRNWAEMAGSGIWFEDYQIYLIVSRVIYYPSGSLAVPTVSFLRGRIFDSQWNHLDGFTVDWYGEGITFPRTFDIPVDWREGGSFMGPEDPRVVLEEGVQGAEPVVVFNMISEQTGGRRAMWMHRPFSNLTTPLHIRGEKEQKMEEKNWAPFFQSDTSPYRRPSHYLNFVYSLQPLQILRCQLLHGHCDWIFQQELPDKLTHTQSHPQVQGNMRGGTNFVPIHQSDPDIRLWAGFPRTHLDGACGSNSTYRPELVILANSGTGFHIIYASDAIDFGTAVLDPTARESPCDQGRILIPSGIVRWEQDRSDLMHLALSVADRSTRIVRIRGISQLVQSLPYLAEWRRGVSSDGEPWGLRWSAVGADVVGCSVDAAMDSSLRNVDRWS